MVADRAFSNSVFFKDTTEISKKEGFFYQLVYNILTWGGIATFVFMSLNFQLADEYAVTEKTPITRHGHLAKGKSDCEEPYIEVKLYGFDKQLMFACGTDVGRYQTVILVVSKGLFGFYVVKSQELSDKQDER